MRFEGNGKIVSIIGDKVIITAKNNLLGRIDAKGNSELTINISEITSTSCKDASLFSNGYIKLYVNGKNSIATTIPFFPRRGIYQEALRFIDNLESIRRNLKYKVSNADEIKKYKELLDMGAISPEEYEKKKKELLNL